MGNDATREQLQRDFDAAYKRAKNPDPRDEEMKKIKKARQMKRDILANKFGL